MSIEAAVAAAELWPLRKLFHAGDVSLRSQNWFGGGLRRRRAPLDGHRTTNACLFRPAPVPVRSRLFVVPITADSTQPSAAASSSDKTIVPDHDDFTLAKVSFGSIGLAAGGTLFSYGFGAYFTILPGSDWSALMLTYGFPLAIIGMALKELARAPSRSKGQNPATHCLISIGAASAFQPTPSVAATGPHDASRCMQPLAATTPECSHKAAASYTHGLVIADLDPSTAKLAIGIMGPLLSAFGFLFVIRIVMSWYPKLPVGKFPYVLAYAPTEPFLMITRKLIPPLGGVDVTPVVWFGLVSFLNEILVGPQGLLVLLSQQV